MPIRTETKENVSGVFGAWRKEKTPTHKARTFEDLQWMLRGFIRIKDLVIALKPPMLGKGWEIPCQDPKRCLSHLSVAA